MLKILINDHCGHPFQVQLSRKLASRGYQVLHTFTAELTTPRGALVRQKDDSPTFEITPIKLGKEFNRYGLLERLRQEYKLGLLVAEKIAHFKPDVVITSNTPLITLKVIDKMCKKYKINRIYWVQDLLGFGIKVNLNKKLPLIGGLLGEYFVWLEKYLLRQSDAIVVITEDFLSTCDRAGVTRDRVSVIYNWAPLDELPVLDKKNAWTQDHGVVHTFNFLYSGTLGMKHNPDLLIELAQHFKCEPTVRIIVASEGIGANYLSKKKKELALNNLMLLPFQDYHQLPRMLAAADVLVALLEPDAGVFAVPSKVLTYLCAGRPLLLAVPPENLAARIVSEHGAGKVVPPNDPKAFVEAAWTLYKNANLRKVMAKKGRTYAEEHFDIEQIADKFETIIKCAVKI
ncbi:glycosyltransferase family 4 protein [Rhodothermus profundi]|uniref:Glycosyltransferase involved in cell wall bisynthesis n=1 Tax=Rhodothermus profundi TaxID=633813 RepID=A0A1M6PJV3_9BACT|nr:glycosyltransferase family 4 protein [Rhodothermus profundi]SHK08174.1 Glycosyltransferase involved in cell wall bisynthesis [Rhodothermus profundi]